MDNRLQSFFFFLFCLTIFSCQEKSKHQEVSETKKVLSAFKVILEKQNEDPDLEKKLTFWKNQLADPKFTSDSVLLSKIHYNIAGVFYATNQLDSVKKHMQFAWLLMEHQIGYEEEKIALYNGLGNVAHREQKIHQENYYYNRAAQMLGADTSLNLSPKQKITIYFSAAQSSAQLRQFDNAFMLNRKAIALLPQLGHQPKNAFRAYSQMASCYYSSNRNLDSLYTYIKKMEEVYSKSPDDEKKRFIFDKKANYFSKLNVKDSTLFYSCKRLAMDLKDAKENGTLAMSVRTGNLHVSHVDLAAIYIDLKKLDSANHHLKACKEFAKKYPNAVDDENLLLYEQNRTSYFFATKNNKAAEREHKALLQRIKFIYETENAQAIAEMATIFQLQAKDKSINALNETISSSQTKLQRNRLWLAISTLAFLLAISIALLLYFIQRQRKLKTEKEKAQLEQRLLRAQMEPHFIFNTLSALQSFIRFKENDKALKYLLQFGRLLRSSLQLSRESSVKLSQEIETLENYLSLQQMRYNDAFSYAININEMHDTESIYIPPMLMQPFVENAILHGIDPNGKNGIITVNLEIEHELLIVVIHDNGKGISEKLENGLHQSLSTAISRERLEIIAKESGLTAGIDIKSAPNNGTTVILSMPINQYGTFTFTQM